MICLDDKYNQDQMESLNILFQDDNLGDLTLSSESLLNNRSSNFSSKNW